MSAQELPSAEGKQELKRALGLKDLVLYGIAMMVPIAPVAVYGAVTQVTQGHMALAYVLALIAMAFTGYSFGQMAGAFPKAGSTYVYTRRGLNQYLGLLSGWTILLDYVLMPIMSFIILAIFASTLFPAVNYWIWVLGAILIVTLVNLRGVTSMAKVTTVLVIFMFAVVVYYVVSSIIGLNSGIGQGTLFSILPFYNKDTFVFSAILAGTAIACFSFLGFDAISTLAEETKNPAKNISAAIIIALVIVAFLFIIQAYLAQLIWPDFTTFPNLDSAFYFVAGEVGGQLLSVLLTLAVVVASLANALDAQAGCSRLLYGMGKDGVIPKKIFGYVHPKTQIPVINIIILAVAAVIGATQGLETVISLINFGALFAFTMVNLSVIGHYFIKERRRGLKNTIRYLVVPALGAIICLLLWFSLSPLSKTVGFIWLAIGIIYTAITTGFFRKPLPELKETKL